MALRHGGPSPPQQPPCILTPPLSFLLPSLQPLPFLMASRSFAVGPGTQLDLGAATSLQKARTWDEGMESKFATSSLSDVFKVRGSAADRCDFSHRCSPLATSALLRCCMGRTYQGRFYQLGNAPLFPVAFVPALLVPAPLVPVPLAPATLVPAPRVPRCSEHKGCACELEKAALFFELDFSCGVCVACCSVVSGDLVLGKRAACALQGVMPVRFWSSCALACFFAQGKKVVIFGLPVRKTCLPEDTVSLSCVPLEHTYALDQLISSDSSPSPLTSSTRLHAKLDCMQCATWTACRHSLLLPLPFPLPLPLPRCVQGAYTGVCSKAHVPSYLNKVDEFKAKGVDSVICTAVNDPYTLHAWAQKLGADKVSCLSLSCVRHSHCGALTLLVSLALSTSLQLEL